MMKEKKHWRKEKEGKEGRDGGKGGKGGKVWRGREEEFTVLVTCKTIYRKENGWVTHCQQDIVILSLSLSLSLGLLPMKILYAFSSITFISSDHFFSSSCRKGETQLNHYLTGLLPLLILRRVQLPGIIIVIIIIIIISSSSSSIINIVIIINSIRMTFIKKLSSKVKKNRTE